MVAVAVAIAGGDSISTTNAAFVQLQTRPIFIRCGGIVVASGIIGTSENLILITYSVTVCIIQDHRAIQTGFAGIICIDAEAVVGVCE